MNFPVFDLHCDTLGALAGFDKKDPVHLRDNKCHIDLNRASSLPGYAQCFAIFTTPYMEDWYSVSPVTAFERDLDAFQREMALNCGTMVQAYTAQDVRDHQAKGLMSAILTIEGPAGFGYDPALLEDLYKAGFRITTLGWNEKNPLTGSHVTGGGLTDLGREYVKEAQRLGMIVDMSHISDEGFWDVLKITSGPVIASHSNSRAVCGHSRNLTDDMFRAICETVWRASISVPLSWARNLLWIPPATISSIFWSWTPRGPILPWAATWTAATKCRRASRACKATRPWQTGFWSGVWTKIPSMASSGTTP